MCFLSVINYLFHKNIIKVKIQNANRGLKSVVIVWNTILCYKVALTIVVSIVVYWYDNAMVLSEYTHEWQGSASWQRHTCMDSNSNDYATNNGSLVHVHKKNKRPSLRQEQHGKSVTKKILY